MCDLAYLVMWSLHTNCRLAMISKILDAFYLKLSKDFLSESYFAFENQLMYNRSGQSFDNQQHSQHFFFQVRRPQWVRQLDGTSFFSGEWGMERKTFLCFKNYIGLPVELTVQFPCNLDFKQRQIVSPVAEGFGLGNKKGC